MGQSHLLRFALVGGLALLVGLHLPSPWRSSFPEATDEAWEKQMQNTAQDAGGKAGNGQKVAVDVYGESLCPDTTHAIRDVIAPLFTNGVSDLMNLHYHAYGKVQETSSGLQCQHGPMECKINRYLNCAQELHPKNQSDWFSYVACVHGNRGQAIEDAASKSCPQERGWDSKQLVQCAEGDLGDKLEKGAQAATKALGRLTFVPWILVNKVPLGHNFEPLQRIVCAAYAGETRPDACFRD